VGRRRADAIGPCPRGPAGMTLRGKGSRRDAESAVSLTVAMVDSIQVDLVRPSLVLPTPAAAASQSCGLSERWGCEGWNASRAIDFRNIMVNERATGAAGGVRVPAKPRMPSAQVIKLTTYQVSKLARDVMHAVVALGGRLRS
jgi:hypothetical protein